jgi:PilZ domain-containing protein
MDDLHTTDGENIADFFDKSGMLPVVPGDVRRFPRFYFRSCAEATIHPLGKGEPSRVFVLTRDLSRNGLSILHSRQLFPGQRLDLVLNGEQPRPVEVVRCKRVTDGSYVIGCRLLRD